MLFLFFHHAMVGVAHSGTNVSRCGVPHVLSQARMQPRTFPFQESFTAFVVYRNAKSWHTFTYLMSRFSDEMMGSQQFKREQCFLHSYDEAR